MSVYKIWEFWVQLQSCCLLLLLTAKATKPEWCFDSTLENFFPYFKQQVSFNWCRYKALASVPKYRVLTLLYTPLLKKRNNDIVISLLGSAA